jgi:DnaJ-class molecular chaperone
MTDDNMCPRCDGSGGGDYPMQCQTCGGRGEVRRASGYKFADDDDQDVIGWGSTDAEVFW